MVMLQWPYQIDGHRLMASLKAVSSYQGWGQLLVQCSHPHASASSSLDQFRRTNKPLYSMMRHLKAIEAAQISMAIRPRHPRSLPSAPIVLTAKPNHASFFLRNTPSCLLSPTYLHLFFRRRRLCNRPLEAHGWSHLIAIPHWHL